MQRGNFGDRYGEDNSWSIIDHFGRYALRLPVHARGGKDAAAFEEKLKEKASVSGGETQIYGDTADASLKFTSEKLKDEFLLNDGHLIIKLDAEVSSINGSTPVYRVVPDMFTSEKVKAWADVLFQGNTAYDAKKIKKWLLKYLGHYQIILKKILKIKNLQRHTSL